jgi:hypothetical protein
MRKRAWLSVPFLTLTFLAMSELPNESISLFNYLCANWWVFPFCASIAANLLLVSNLLLGSRVRLINSEKLLSGAYLMVGPSLAVLGGSSIFGIAIPSWLGYVAPVILPASAWAFYHSLRPSEDGVEISREHNMSKHRIPRKEDGGAVERRWSLSGENN